MDLNNKPLPLDKAFVLKEGSDITIISWGATLIEAQKAVEQLEKLDINAELIDLATIKPIDITTILASVQKTGRALIAHEAVKTGGVGAEIAAQLAEKAMPYLQAPIKRVTGFDAVMPYFKLEDYFLPNANKIMNTAAELMEY